ncbi:calcium-dependent protein kinase 4 [Tanacetum coccineum]
MTTAAKLCLQINLEEEVDFQRGFGRRHERDSGNAPSRHKNIVTIKGVYEDPLYVHIVIEHCNGGELFDRREHYSERKAPELTKTIVSVVEACHSFGVMHKDLEPENFLVVNRDDDFSLKAFDFRLSVKYSRMLFKARAMLHLRLLKHYDPEAYVWTAQVILYILLSGVPLFWAEGGSTEAGAAAEKDY